MWPCGIPDFWMAVAWSLPGSPRTYKLCIYCISAASTSRAKHYCLSLWNWTQILRRYRLARAMSCHAARIRNPGRLHVGRGFSVKICMSNCLKGRRRTPSCMPGSDYCSRRSVFEEDIKQVTSDCLGSTGIWVAWIPSWWDTPPLLRSNYSKLANGKCSLSEMKPKTSSYDRRWTNWCRHNNVVVNNLIS